MRKILAMSQTASLMLVAGVTFTLNFVAVALVSILTINSAEAIVVGGTVTGGTAGGSFVELTVPFGNASTPDNSVGNNNFQSPNLYAFDENQNITLTGPLNVDLGGIGGVIAAGVTVASHYVFFDPLNSRTIIGSVDFDANILGVATSTANLNASDVLQNNSVTYLAPTLRGLESGDITSFNLMTLFINWGASSPGDYVRVFTERSPGADIGVVPLPAALPLYGTGLALMGFIGWRRKQQRKVAV